MKIKRKQFRKQVFARDRGVCAKCGTDCTELEAIRRGLWKAGDARSRKFWEELRDRGFRHASSLWEVDHIVPLSEGGPDELSACRTLCLPCHKDETDLMRARRRAARGWKKHRYIVTQRRSQTPIDILKYL